MYYRCDCCGAEQEVLEIGKYRTRQDPMGTNEQYRAPKALKQDGVQDLCSKCHTEFDALYQDLYEKYEKNLDVSLHLKFNEMRRTEK
jgi:hypothetical protein